MDFPEAKRFIGRHDFVLVGYRGVDGSSRLDCPEVVTSMAHSRDLLSRASLASNASAYRACAKRLQDEGVDLAGYSLAERVEDLELARHRLGYGPIDLISESAGTRTAMIYAWRHPQSINRSVMVAANPPGNYLWNPKTTDEQIHRYAVVCAQAQDCRGRTPDLAASIHSAYAKIPSRFWFLPIKKGNVRIAGFFGLINSTNGGGGPLAAPKTIDTLLSIDKGNGAGGAWLLSLFAGAALPHGQVWGDVASVARIDAAYGKRLFASGADRGSVIGNPGTEFLWSGGRLLNAWPANSRREGIQQRPQLERPDAADQRPARLRRAARERDSPAPASPPERSPGRPPEARARRRLLGLRARRVHPPDRQLPRQRSRRHLPLHDQPA